MRQIGVAVVGCGVWGVNHARVYAGLDKARLVKIAYHGPRWEVDHALDAAVAAYADAGVHVAEGAYGGLFAYACVVSYVG
jgi:predicted dehydrogenase